MTDVRPPLQPPGQPTPPPHQPPPIQQSPYPGPRSNGAATAGFVISLLALLAAFASGGGLAWLLTIAGGVFSVIGAARASQALVGRGFSTAGIVLSVLALLGCLAHAASATTTTPRSTTSGPLYSTSASAPTTTTAPTVPMRTYSGTGDDVVRLDKPPGIAVVSFSCPACTSNTIVTSDGPDLTLVNEIGSYNGRRWLDETDNSLTTELTIKAHGRWTLTVGGLDQARHVNGPVSGNGDDVILLQGSTTAAAVTNRGSSNFVVHNIDTRGRINLPINEIGGYTGTVSLRAPSIVEVQSSGNWTITPQ